MHPKIHALTSTVAVVIYTVWAGLGGADIFLWAFIALAATLAIDLDHFIIQAFTRDGRKRLKKIITDPIGHASSERIIQTLHYPGFGVLRMKTHMIQTAALTASYPAIGSPLIVPVIISVWVHCMMDAIELATKPASR
jgi:hypothetical protein